MEKLKTELFEGICMIKMNVLIIITFLFQITLVLTTDLPFKHSVLRDNILLHLKIVRLLNVNILLFWVAKV